MNFLNFNQAGGFRLSTEILAATQAAYSLFNALAFIAGEKTIISGCNVTGSNVSDGVVFLNGEVYNFKGGSISANVIVRETVKSYPFQDGTVKPVISERYVTFGTALPEQTYLWSDFKRIFATKDIQSFKDDHEARLQALENKPSEWPVGAIIRYDQPLVVLPPAGWEDWNPVNEQGRVWVARSESDGDFGLGSIGGAKTHTLTQAQLPNVNLQFKTGKDRVGSGNQNALAIFDTSDFTRNISLGGSNQPHNNLQPYIAVRFIKRIS